MIGHAGKICEVETEIATRDHKSAGAVSMSRHGGIPINRFLPEDKRNEILDRLEKIPSLTITGRQWADVALIATGAYSPLIGFVGEKEYRSIISRGRLSDGLAWTIPVLLLVHRDQAEDLELGDEVILRDRDGKNLALLHLEEVYEIDHHELGRLSADSEHPGAMDFYEEDLLAVAGPIEVIRLHDEALLRRRHPALSGHE